MNRRLRNIAIERVSQDAGFGNPTSRRVILNALKRAGATHSQAKDVLKSVTADPATVVPVGQSWLWQIQPRTL